MKQSRRGRPRKHPELDQQIDRGMDQIIEADDVDRALDGLKYFVRVIQQVVRRNNASFELQRRTA